MELLYVIHSGWKNHGKIYLNWALIQIYMKFGQIIFANLKVKFSYVADYHLIHT